MCSVKLSALMFSITSGRQTEGDATISLVELCQNGDLEGVKAALQNGADVNTKDEYGWTGLMEAGSYKHNSVVALLLNTPNIYVNLKTEDGTCALHYAVKSENNEALKMLLNVPSIDVNTNSVDDDGCGADQTRPEIHQKGH